MSQMHMEPPGQQAVSCSTMLEPTTWMQWMLCMPSALGACSKSKAQVHQGFLHGLLDMHDVQLADAWLSMDERSVSVSCG